VFRATVARAFATDVPLAALKETVDPGTVADTTTLGCPASVSVLLAMPAPLDTVVLAPSVPPPEMMAHVTVSMGLPPPGQLTCTTNGCGKGLPGAPDWLLPDTMDRAAAPSHWAPADSAVMRMPRSAAAIRAERFLPADHSAKRRSSTRRHLVFMDLPALPPPAFERSLMGVANPGALRIARRALAFARPD
jgi:hypothetical protein